jgi:hypothetical protein
MVFALGNRMETPDCLVEQAVNAALDDAFDAAQALLITRLGEVTLADLAADFHERWKRNKTRKANPHAA